MLSVLKNIVKITNKRVYYYGAPYTLFAIFGLFNYPLSALYHLLVTGEVENLFLRVSCTVLSLILLAHSFVSSRFKKYIPLYWYFTVCFTIPFFATYMTLANHVSLMWIMNNVLGVFLLVLVVDWWMFCILLVIGIVLGATSYLLFGGEIIIVATNDEVKMALYMSVFAVILGGVFSRSKELVHRSHITKTEAEKFFLETEVAKRTENLKRSLAANRRFLANISHEVRTPLQGIIGVAKELAEEWKALDDKTKYFYVKLMASNSDKLKRLMNNILDLTKFTSGKMRLDYKDDVDITKIIEEVRDVGKAFIISEKKDLTIKIKVKDKINRSLYCDQMRISQVLTNLVSNAIKHTEKGEILISVDNTNDGVLVSIQDCGDGIPRGEEEQIFEAFVQSSNNINKGKGLGLALCQEIIQSHGGQIWVKNVCKHGSVVGACFSFVVPYGKESKAESQELDKANIVILEESDKLSLNTVRHYDLPVKRSKDIPLRIAVVDDEFVCLEAVKLYLYNLDYEIYTFEGGKEILDYLRSGKEVDLILLDIMMPHVDGFRVVEEMSQDKKLSSIPIVLQTGLSDLSKIQDLYLKDAMVLGRILKPYDRKVLLEVIKNIYG